MRIYLHTIVCIFLTCLAAADLRADLLIGLSWSSPEQLEQIAAAAPQVRYVTSQKVFVSGDEFTLRRLEALGVSSFFVEEYGPDDSYFLTRYRHYSLDVHLQPSYEDPAGWALVRLSPSDEGYALPHFLFPLPEDHSIEGWTRLRPRGKLATPLGADAMADLLVQVDAERLQRHVRTLALKDPDLPGTGDNLRSRFAVHPETRESTEYIRQQLADVLGEEAVEVREFTIDEGRLSAHLRDRGDGPVDGRAYNVVGVLPGSDPQAGYYVICGHYDATGVRSPGWNWRTDPAPGADDNATGTALILESARVLASQEFQFPWSIRFIAFSGEELGMLGSRDYAAAAAATDDAILGVFNFDMFGYNDIVDRIELATNPASRWLADLMVQAEERYDIGLRVDLLEDGNAILSDHASFWARGYDAILGIENYLPTDSTTVGVRQGLYRINTQYHSVRDVPDSLNWNLVRKSTQLAVATLASYALESGLPNLSVFTGDLRGDGQGNLYVQISNIGTGLLDAPFRVRVSHCETDSSDCQVIYDAEQTSPLYPGIVKRISIPWEPLGEMAFLLEVDPENRIFEEEEEDNRVFQKIYLQPQNRIAVYPNPYSSGRDDFLVFAGVPFNAYARIYDVNGDLIWSAQEDDLNQRIELGAHANEIRWNGLNQDRIPVDKGRYPYELTTSEGTLLEEGSIEIIDEISEYPRVQISVFPNPFNPAKNTLLRFSGLPLRARVQIFTLSGRLVWSEVKKYRGKKDWEIRWIGVNQSGFVVNSGVYIYAITAADGELLERNKIAVIR